MVLIRIMKLYAGVVMERPARLDEIKATASYMARDLNKLLELGIKL
jgi:hypothetical protein